MFDNYYGTIYNDIRQSLACSTQCLHAEVANISF